MDHDDSAQAELTLEPEPELEASEYEPDLDEGDAAAEAFGRLEEELALVRRAVGQLAAERADIVIPDYEPTLVKMTGSLNAIGQRLAQIEQMPAMEMTPESFGERIAAAARSARAEDEKAIQHWKAAAHDHERALSWKLASACEREEQIWRERWIFAAGVALAVLLMSFLPGAIARELPASWRLPDRMAQRVLRAPEILQAGIRLIQNDNPQLWSEIIEAAELSAANRNSLKACKSAARKAKHPVSCSIRVGK